MKKIEFKMLAFFLLILVAGLLPAESLQLKSEPGVKVEDSGKKQPIIAILGSSMAAGWVTSREAKFDMKNGWAFRLERLLAPKGYRVINISMPGDTTDKVLDRLEKDLFPLDPDIVIISLSLENEGIRGLWDKEPQKVYADFRDNLKIIIEKCKKNGISPVVASCYASDNFTEDWHYAFIKKMNLELAQWQIPGINLLGALDDGTGRFVEGITFDLDHPDSVGHEELFHSIVPGMFDKILQGIPLSNKSTSNGFFPVRRREQTTPLSYISEHPIHSYTMHFEVRSMSPGTIASILGYQGRSSQLIWLDESRFQYISADGQEHFIKTDIEGKSWNGVCISHRFIMGETRIFINGNPVFRIEEDLLPLQFILGGPGGDSPKFESSRSDYREWMVYRTALNTDEAITLHQGILLQPSLELYVPLSEPDWENDEPLKNHALNSGSAFGFPSAKNMSLKHLRDQIEDAVGHEKIYVDPSVKKAIEVSLSSLKNLEGVYEVDSGLKITITLEDERLFSLFNDGKEGKLELFPLSPTRFFMNIVGPEAGMEFKNPVDGQTSEFLMQIGPQKIVGKRVRLP
ncbi:MAG: GDSL-type esterase/lipase family protein [Candidatus Aminicenantes bacterium]|nr:GDSL-type esterase/lipase family protein [Candidatus Aminicenantes bacterium]